MEEIKETNSSIHTEYCVCHENVLATQMKYQRPLIIRIIFWMGYFAIIICTTIYGQHYAKQNYEQYLIIFLVTMQFLALGLLLCGGWSLVQKTYYYFAKKKTRKLLPELTKQREELLQMKYCVIDSTTRGKEKALSRPYSQCPYPSQLKTQWKEQERILHDLTMLEFVDQPNKLSTNPVIWFLLAIIVAISSFVVVIGIYLLIVVFMLLALFTMLAVHFSRNEDPRMYQTVRPNAEAVPKYEVPKTSSKIATKKESARINIKKAKKEAIETIEKIKKDLTLWGYVVPNIF